MYRALQSYEIQEIFTNGQPLSEIATGSTLQGSNEDALDQIRQTILSQGQETTEGDICVHQRTQTYSCMHAYTCRHASIYILHI